MGISTKVIKGTGIKLLENQETETIERIIDYFNGERFDYESLIEDLEICLPESIEIQTFGNQVIDSRSDPFGIMLSGDTQTIQNIIDDLNLNKTISDMAEVYIG